MENQAQPDPRDNQVLQEPQASAERPDPRAHREHEVPQESAVRTAPQDRLEPPGIVESKDPRDLRVNQDQLDLLDLRDSVENPEPEENLDCLEVMVREILSCDNLCRWVLCVG